jgi:hypothetical protein
MAVGDLAHDREPEPGALAGGALHAVKALEHALALGGRDARSIVLDLEEGIAFRRPVRSVTSPPRGV